MSTTRSLSSALALLGALAAPPCLAAPWVGDLTPIGDADWTYDRAAHLLERAGFGGTPEQIERLRAMGPRAAVENLVDFVPTADLPPYDESPVYDASLEPFPASRPATTVLAKKTGEALGVKVRPGGNRPMQAIVNRFFYWLRASSLETNRLAYWWSQRMVANPNPLQEKMALFWHGHFATSEEKVRDYRKMRVQLDFFEREGLGNFGTLALGVARDPAMLAFLDAGVNVKGAPNENFAREIMELFTMGVGNYSEKDIREAARAFTGWNSENLVFHEDPTRHDAAPKTVLGRTGNFDGDEVVDIILAQPVTAEYIASKTYRFFAREELTPELRTQLGAMLRESGYEMKPLLRTIFLSRDFYSAPSMGTRVKGPVELLVSTYRKLGQHEVPGVPDFNDATSALGQQLFRPPTVAGWAQGEGWITPGLLLERGNLARQILFPDISYIPHDRYPRDPTVRIVGEKVAQGLDLTTATKPEGKESDDGTGMGMAMSNRMADAEEEFNTRYASYRGWQMAIEKVKPIARTTAAVDLSAMIRSAGLASTGDAVDYLLQRFLSVPIEPARRNELVGFLNNELGTSSLAASDSFMEEPLRLLLHLILSLPEYQLG